VFRTSKDRCAPCFERLLLIPMLMFIVHSLCGSWIPFLPPAARFLVRACHCRITSASAAAPARDRYTYTGSWDIFQCTVVHHTALAAASELPDALEVVQLVVAVQLILVCSRVPPRSPHGRSRFPPQSIPAPPTLSLLHLGEFSFGVGGGVNGPFGSGFPGRNHAGNTDNEATAARAPHRGTATGRSRSSGQQQQEAAARGGNR
jgi:hypothetical protein